MGEATGGEVLVKDLPNVRVGKIFGRAERLVQSYWDRAHALKWARERSGMALARGQARTMTGFRRARYIVWPASRGGRSAIDEYETRGGGADAQVTGLNLPQKCTVRFCDRSNTVIALKARSSGVHG